jgi:hypothetical protein
MKHETIITEIFQILDDLKELAISKVFDGNTNAFNKQKLEMLSELDKLFIKLKKSELA